MTALFPRKPDRLGHAWGLHGSRPVQIWERFSPAYEAQAERIAAALAARGLTPRLGGAGSEDGEYLEGLRGGDPVFFQHLEDPGEARYLASLDDAALGALIDGRLAERGPDAR